MKFTHRIAAFVLLAATLGAARPAHATWDPIFEESYWWHADGSTTIGGNHSDEQDVIVAVGQLDLYDRDAGKTAFLYFVENLRYYPSQEFDPIPGNNGLSGFELLDIGMPFTYLDPAFSDPVTGNPWLAIDGPANATSPEWEASFGNSNLPDPFVSTPDVQGLYAPDDPTRPTDALQIGLFGFMVDGLVGITTTQAQVHSWGVVGDVTNVSNGADLRFGLPTNFHGGLVSAPTTPEPNTLLYVGIGLAALVVVRRKNG